jgi:hypothetical protein
VDLRKHTPNALLSQRQQNQTQGPGPSMVPEQASHGSSQNADSLQRLPNKPK